MPNDGGVKCPYFVTKSGKEKKTAAITCENLENNLGFEVRNQLTFKNHAEKQDYCQIFCMDRYQSCPYFEGIYQYQRRKKK